MKRATSLIFTLATLLCMSAGNGDPQRPYKARQTLTTVSQRPVGNKVELVQTGGGLGTHVGRYAIVQVTLFDPVTLAFEGSGLLTAADGSTQEFEYSGSSATGQSIGTYAILGGTKRFADADGAGQFEGTFLSPTVETDVVTGWLSY